MPRPDNPQLEPVVLQFGAGLNTRSSETAADPHECVEGRNFGLDVVNYLFTRRKPFDLVATAPNEEPVVGFVQLLKVDGTISTLVQAGTNVYEWDGAADFGSGPIGTVAAGTKIRGYLQQNFTLDDIVLITDLALQEVVHTWDGTTFAPLAHNLGSGVDFKARYGWVENERAIFANISATIAVPHMVVISGRGSATTLSVTNRASSALSEEDPAYVLATDLKPINGIVSAFGLMAFSTRRGQIHKLTGDSAKDWAIKSLHPNSAAVGDEALVYVGNDAIYGRQGRIESLSSTDAFGDVETDDLSLHVAPDIETVDDWLLAFSSRYQKLYCWDRSNSRLWVLHKSILDERIRSIVQQRDVSVHSPWSLWKTTHGVAFQTDVCMPLLNPATGLEELYFGGQTGEIFRLEGGGDQDGGTDDITAKRVSKTFQPPVEGRVTGISGEIRYRKISAVEVNIRVLYAGESLNDETISIQLPSAGSPPVYSGGNYYSGGAYYSTVFKGRFSKQPWAVPGTSSEFQIDVSVTGDKDFFIEELRFTFQTA